MIEKEYPPLIISRLPLQNCVAAHYWKTLSLQMLVLLLDVFLVVLLVVFLDVLLVVLLVLFLEAPFPA